VTADAGLVTLVSNPGQQLRVEVLARADRPGGTLKYSSPYEDFRPCQGCGGPTDLPNVYPYDYVFTDAFEDGGLFRRSCGDVSTCEGRRFIDLYDRRADGGPGYMQFHYALDLVFGETEEDLEKTPATLDLQLRFFDGGFAPGFGTTFPDGGMDAGP